VTSTEQVNAAVRAAAEWGRINALVNVAGGSGPKRVRDIEGIDDSDWDFVIDLNLKSVFLFCRAVVPHMRAPALRPHRQTTSSSYSRGRKGPVTTQRHPSRMPPRKAGIIGFGAQAGQRRRRLRHHGEYRRARPDLGRAEGRASARDSKSFPTPRATQC